MLQVKSSDSVQTISVNRAEVLAALKTIASKIKAQHPEVLSVRIFGSLARGDQVGTSDVDVLIILRGTESGDPIEWIRRYYGYFRLPIPVDLLVYNEAQIEQRLQADDPGFKCLWIESLESF